MANIKTNKSRCIKFYNGNVKVGDMLTFNKLAGNVELNGCKGTCGDNCKYCWNAENWKKSSCYVAKSYVQYGSMVIDSHIANTNAMRENPWKAIKELNSQLKRKRTNKTVRIHSSGELETTEELKAWLWLASQHPNRSFYIYTKAYAIVDKVLTRYKGKLPSNFYINISIWHEQGLRTFNKWKYLPTIRAFVYDDGTFEYAYPESDKKEVVKCPAYDENGKLKHDLTCDRCKICFQDKKKICVCHSH